MDRKNGNNVKPVPPHIHRHLTALYQSGKTVTDYCRKAGISTWSIYDWKRRFGDRISMPAESVSPRTDKPAVSFAALGTMTTRCFPPVRFDIRLNGGICISIYEGTTAEELAPFLMLVTTDGAGRC